MTEDEYFDALDAAIAGVLAVPADRYGLPVPSCPGWDVGRVLEHLVSVHTWITDVVRRGDLSPAPRDRTLPPAGPDVTARFAEAAAAMVATFRSTDLERPVGTFTGVQPTRWFLRRQVHETTIHRWDAESGAGSPTPLAADVAADCVDELLIDLMPDLIRKRPATGVEGTVHVHATDVAGEWLVRVAALSDDGATPVDVTRSHAKGDVAVRGPAADLALLVWGRSTPTADGLTTFGDADLLGRWLHAIRF